MSCSKHFFKSTYYFRNCLVLLFRWGPFRTSTECPNDKWKTHCELTELGSLLAHVISKNYSVYSTVVFLYKASRGFTPYIRHFVFGKDRSRFLFRFPVLFLHIRSVSPQILSFNILQPPYNLMCLIGSVRPQCLLWEFPFWFADWNRLLHRKLGQLYICFSSLTGNTSVLPEIQCLKNNYLIYVVSSSTCEKMV